MINEAQQSKPPFPPLRGGDPRPHSRPPQKRVLWPVALSRQTIEMLDGHPGMTIAVFVLLSLGGTVLFSFASLYEWTLWQRSWQMYSPLLAGTDILIGILVVMLLGVAFWQVLEGWIWGSALVFFYTLGQLRLAAHDAAQAALAQGKPAEVVATLDRWSSLATFVRGEPGMVVIALLHAVVPVVVIWMLLILWLSLIWPTIQAVSQVGLTAIVGAVRGMHNVRQVRDSHEEWTTRRLHEQQMKALEYQDWSQEQLTQQKLHVLANEHRRREELLAAQQLLTHQALVDEQHRPDGTRPDILRQNATTEAHESVDQMTMDEFRAWHAAQKHKGRD